jgi:hypothetical protein
MGTKSLAWEGMDMRQHLQLSADVMSIMEKTSDAVAAGQRLVEAGSLPRQMAAEGTMPRRGRPTTDAGLLVYLTTEPE